MAADLITPSKALGYSDLYLDFLAGAESARQFYPSVDIGRLISCLEAVPHDRARMAAILERQNRSFGATEHTRGNINKLKDERALCVFGGQQAGLFGGPMLVVNKALGLVKAADHYSRLLGRPVIPVFWIAGDDHDFDEINHTWVLDRAGEPVRIVYETRPEHLFPASELRFADAGTLQSAVQACLNALGETEFTPALSDIIRRSYTTQDTFVSSFGKFMTGLFGGLDLVLFNPGDPEVKALAAPFFELILDRTHDVNGVLAATNGQLLAAGYHLQVEKKDNSAHLFYNNGGRRPLTREGERFAAGDESFSFEDLKRLLADHPERFSPDVLLRPIVQSYLFPAAVQMGGPSEIAYFAQLRPLFELFGLAPPVYKARPTVTLLEKRLEKVLTEYGMRFEDLTGDIELAVNRVLAKTFPADIGKRLELLHWQTEKAFDDFTSDAVAFDAALGDYAKQTFGKIDFTLKAFEAKVFASHKKKSQESRDRIYRLQNGLFPLHRLQERSLNIAYFLSRYGPDLISFMDSSIDGEQSAHQIVHLSELRS